MTRRSKLLIIGSAILVVIAITLLLGLASVIQWSGYADVTIVIKTVNSQNEPIPECSVVLRNPDDPFGTDSELQWQGTTDEYGIVTLTRRFDAGGTTSNNLWGQRKTVSINWGSRVFFCTADGYEPTKTALWNHAPHPLVNPDYPIVVPIYIEMQPTATITGATKQN